MNIYFKVGFLLAILIFGFIIIIPSIQNQNIGSEIIFFGAGEADSILIKNKSKTILIDTGLKSDRVELGDKIRTLGVKTIDYLILTHPDKDHIGGASYILDNFQVNNLIQSSYKKNNKAENRIEKSLEEKSINNLILTEDYNFLLGDLEVKIYSPKSKDYKKSNDNSLITLIKDRKLSYLFAGDAEEELLDSLIDENLSNIDLYKVPHHGRWNSKSEEIIKGISPKIAVVTNDLADERIVESLEKEDSKIFYAFREDLLFFSDGEKIENR